MKTETLRDIRVDSMWDDEPTNPGYLRKGRTDNESESLDGFRQARTCPEIPSLRIGNKSIIMG